MIYVSHDFREALSLANSVVILNKGKIIQIGTPEEVFSKPVNTFVATLLGDLPMNLVDFEEGEIKNGNLMLKKDDMNVLIKGTSFIDMRLGKVKLGFRHFAASIKSSNEANCIPGSVYVSEPIEDTKIYTISIGTNLVKIVTPRKIMFEINQNVFIKLNPMLVHLFDGQTGERLKRNNHE